MYGARAYVEDIDVFVLQCNVRNAAFGLPLLEFIAAFNFIGVRESLTA